MAILDFTPAKLDLVLYKRDDAQFQVQFLDVQGVAVGLTGATAIAQIRNDQGALLGTLDLTVNATDDVVVVTVPKEQYTTWTWTQGFYDLQVTLSNGDVKTLATGTITIKGDISYD
jgi:hypothetical protein